MLTVAPPAPALRPTPIGASAQVDELDRAPFPPYRRPRRRRGLPMVAAVLAALVIIAPVFGIALVTWGVVTANHAATEARELNDPALSDADRASLSLAPSVTTLFGPGAAAAVVDSLDESIVGRTQFTQISLYSDYAVAVVQDVGVPGHLDQYPWRSGRVGPASPRPTPRSTEAEADPTALAFTADEVRWSAVAGLTDEAVALTGVENGAVTHVIVDRSTFDADLRVTIRIYVSGPRSSGFVEATATGDVIAVY